MQISFVVPTGVPFHSKTVEERPLGGTESAVIYLARELSRQGCSVKVFTPFDNPPLSEPLFLPLRAVYDLKSTDILIAVREWQPLHLPIKAKKKLLWTGDSYDQPLTFGWGDKRIANSIDELLFVSEWHRKTFCEAAHFPLEKSWVIRNGVDLSLFEQKEIRNPKKLIYSSTPFRGLIYLPHIFSEIKKKHPESELHVFSGFDVYTAQNEKHPLTEKYAPLFKELRRTPQCFTFGNVPQKELAKAFTSSAILAYPNTFEETSCITIMEAQAGGCVPVTSALGALPETVGTAGVLLSEKPGTDEYITKFIAEVDALFSNPAKWQELSDAALKRAPQNSWEAVARRFLEHIS